jgi:hypothetical protein
MVNPAIIFWLGAGIALVSFALSFLVPRHPEAGRETVLATPRLQAAE